MNSNPSSITGSSGVQYPHPLPQSVEEWEKQRPGLRVELWRLLGDLPPTFTPQPTVTSVERREGYSLERFEFDNGAGATVYGYVLIPAELKAPAPAVLYHHAHGGNYPRGKNELFHDSPMGVSPVDALMAAGYVVVAIDAYAFGQRATVGPGGPMEAGREVETSWFKKFLWEGRTLWGMMVRDDLLALNILLSRPEVDPARVAATGMSLGGSRATWLSALDDRIAVTIPVAQMTRYRAFAERGDFTRHSVYYYVPGALRSAIDMEVLVSLAAPRKQLILIGDADPLSPIEGVHAINDYARQIYALYGASDRFETRIYRGVEHAYTPEMFAAMLDALNRYARAGSL